MSQFMKLKPPYTDDCSQRKAAFQLLLKVKS